MDCDHVLCFSCVVSMFCFVGSFHVCFLWTIYISLMLVHNNKCFRYLIRSPNSYVKLSVEFEGVDVYIVWLLFIDRMYMFPQLAKSWPWPEILRAIKFVNISSYRIDVANYSECNRILIFWYVSLCHLLIQPTTITKRSFWHFGLYNWKV